MKPKLAVGDLVLLKKLDAAAPDLDCPRLAFEGWDADLTLVDIDHARPVRDAEMLTRVRWSPFDGRDLYGWPVYTIVGGRNAYDCGQISANVRASPLSLT